jgi:hypothetical protein
MKFSSQQTKRKITPKLSALLIALSSAFFVVACGGGGSAVGSDSADSVKSSNDSNSSSSGSSSSNGSSIGSDDDNDHCSSTPTPTPAVAKDKSRDDDDEDNDDDDDDDKNCVSTPLPPLTAADLAAGKLGKALWAANCFSCHGSDTHEVRTSARILNAINENKGGMGVLKGVITATDAANIAIYAVRPSAF